MPGAELAPQPDPSLTFDNVGLPGVAPAPGTPVTAQDALIMGDEAPPLGPPAPIVPPALPPPALSAQPSGMSPAAAPPVAPTGEIKDIAKANVDQQLAARAEGTAQQTTDAAVAAKQDESAAAYQKQAEALRIKGEQDARANDLAHRQTEDALTAARDTKIPDFWAGREGKHAEMALWVGLSGAAAGLLGQSGNGAAEIVKDKVDAYYRREKDKIDNLYKFAAAKGQSEEGLRVQQAHALAGLQAQYGATNNAIAARIESMKTAGQGRIDGAKADALSAQFAEKGNQQILEAKKTYAEINKINADAAKAREERKGTSPAAVAAEAKLAAMIEQGVPASQVRAAAAAAGVKPQRVDALETQGRAAAKGGAAEQAAKDKAEAKKMAVDDATAVRDGKGRVRGYAPSARNVKPIEDRVVQYDDAIDALKALKASGKTVPYGDLYDRAVLAVAATTQANASDKTTTHEAGTLKNWGLISADAIDRTLEHVQTRQQKFMNQLRPLADDGTSAEAPKAAVAKSVKMPNGQILNFDAAGNPVQ